MLAVVVVAVVVVDAANVDSGLCSRFRCSLAVGCRLVVCVYALASFKQPNKIPQSVEHAKRAREQNACSRLINFIIPTNGSPSKHTQTSTTAPDRQQQRHHHQHQHHHHHHRCTARCSDNVIRRTHKRKRRAHMPDQHAAWYAQQVSVRFRIAMRAYAPISLAPIRFPFLYTRRRAARGRVQYNNMCLSSPFASFASFASFAPTSTTAIGSIRKKSVSVRRGGSNSNSSISNNSNSSDRSLFRCSVGRFCVAVRVPHTCVHSISQYVGRVVARGVRNRTIVTDAFSRLHIMQARFVPYDIRARLRNY